MRIQRFGIPVSYTHLYKGRLITPEEFGEIVIRSSDNGEVLKLKEIADREMGEESLSLIHI